jgi:hypothetical protein
VCSVARDVNHVLCCAAHACDAALRSAADAAALEAVLSMLSSAGEASLSVNVSRPHHSLYTLLKSGAHVISQDRHSMCVRESQADLSLKNV